MPINAFGLHHHHKKKRGIKRMFHFSRKWKKSIDRFAYAGGVAAPILTIPQLLEIWIGQSAAGVSLFTWGSYLILSIYWTAYGIIHRYKPIIVMYASQASIQIFIILGILLYK